jgi:hypothetical protein
MSEPLLEELISYNDKGNFDRVMALAQVLIYREQLYNTLVEDKNESTKQEALFGGPIFKDYELSLDVKSPFFSFDYSIL